ncbi:MAG: SpoIIIAH-like family protein [Defluviitaleaceae bacterium]|nr:SpoIIIAH-like family protein [Defluviitaleaceae bacterium]
MFALRRNQVIITALVVMIAVAGYLNYTDARRMDDPVGIMLDDRSDITTFMTDGETITSVFGGDLENSLEITHNPYIAVSDGIAVLPTSSEVMSEPGEAVFVSTSVNLPFFVEAKLEREQARSKQRDILLEMINNDNIEQAQRAESANAMLEIQSRIEKETASEAMIEAKGFREAYVRIGPDTVDVVVGKEALTDADVAQIEDIVRRKTGMDTSQIRISTLRR